MTLLDYIEKQAAENAAFHVESMTHVSEWAKRVLSILLLFGGAVFAFVVSVLEDGLGDDVDASWLVGSVALTIWLFALVGVLLAKAINFADAKPVTNEPQNLRDGFDNISAEGSAEPFDDLRWNQLGRLQEDIGFNVERNRERAKWINRVVWASLFSPAVFGVAWVVAWALAAV
ncbi:MAG: hypothetical protein AAGG50_03840 [Bacteroidota bacterium]